MLKAKLEEKYGRVYETFELSEHFRVKTFICDQVIVSRRADGVIGVMKFTSKPRFYYDFQPDTEYAKDTKYLL